MSDIELHERYPLSRREDITDAYMRGVEFGRKMGRGTCRKVYLVETSDDLLESWYPVAVYLHRESAEDCAEALRKEEDGIKQFARVSELKVVDG